MSKKDNIQYTAYESYTMLADRELRALKMKNSGMNIGEIAEALGLKKNTVSVYLTRAKQKIDGTFDYEKEKRYRNEGARKRKQSPEYRKKIREYAREYAHNNPEKTKERAQKYREENVEKIRAYQREYHKEYYRKKHPLKKKAEKPTRTPKSELYMLSDQRAKKIIEEKKRGKTIREIAEEQGCSPQNIYSILNRHKKRTETPRSF